MGQYHWPVNLDRKEYLASHTFGDGLKLMEFGMSGEGMMTGLALLLAVSNGRGGGDLHIWTPSTSDSRGMQPFGGEPTKKQQRTYDAILGRWGGDRIAIVGDYYEPGDIKRDHTDAGRNVYSEMFPSWQDENEQWHEGESDWLDISDVVLEAMRLDFYFNKGWEEKLEEEKERGFSFIAGRPKTSRLNLQGEIVKVKPRKVPGA